MAIPGIKCVFMETFVKFSKGSLSQDVSKWTKVSFDISSEVFGLAEFSNGLFSTF